MEQDPLHRAPMLFRNPSVFATDYIPEPAPSRAAPMKQLALKLRPGMVGATPGNVICRGPPGTGKTACVRSLFADIEEMTDRFIPAYVDCRIDRTKYKVFSRIFGKIFGYAPPQAGVSIQSVMDAIGGALQRREISLIICLDDANLLHYNNTLGDVVNSLLRLHQDYPGARTAVFATISDMDIDLVRDLDAWVVSVFRPTTIYFPPYDAEEIRGILRERVRVGLYPNVVSPEMLGCIVEQTMESGDLRVGIDLVKRTVIHAEAAGRTEVLEEDVMAAYEQAKHIHLAFTVRALSAGERLLFWRIAELSQEQTEPLTSRAVYAEVKDASKIGYTAFFKRLQKLDSLRAVDLLRVQSGGRSSEIVLRYEPEKVKEVCR